MIIRNSARLFRVGLFLFASAHLAAPAVADVIKLNPTADAFVTNGPSNNLGDNNYGAAGALEISASGLSKGTFDSVMKYDFSTAKRQFDGVYGTGKWAIASATLQLNTAPPGNAIFNSPNASGKFSIKWMQSDAWTEGNGDPSHLSTTGGITYNSLPTFLGSSDQVLGTYSFVGAASGTNTYTLALPSSFASDMTSGSLVSFELYAATGDNTVSYLFNSNDFTTATSRPVLTITATPEPAALGLIAFAAIGLLQRRPRR